MVFNYDIGVCGDTHRCELCPGEAQVVGSDLKGFARRMADQMKEPGFPGVFREYYASTIAVFEALGDFLLDGARGQLDDADEGYLFKVVP